MTCPLCHDCPADRWQACLKLERTGLAPAVSEHMGAVRTLAYVRGYAVADDERQRERMVWVALLVACAVTAYSVGRYLVAPRVLSGPPPAACRVVRCGGLAPVTPGNLTPDGGPVE